MSKTTYDVYDEKKKKKILENADSSVLEEVLGVKPIYISGYARRKNLYHRRYRIEVNTIKEVQKQINQNDVELMNRFDAAMKSLKRNYRPEQLARIEFVCAGDTNV